MLFYCGEPFFCLFSFRAQRFSFHSYTKRELDAIKAAGIDPVYFGVLFIINNSIGLVTPPVGTVLNVVAGVGRMRMDDVTRGVVPFMVVQFVVMFLMVVFPQIVMVPAHWFY